MQAQFKRVVRRLPSRRRIVHHRGARLIVDPAELSGYYLYYEHRYDTEVFDFLEQMLPGFERALDLGANIGVYSVYFASRVSAVDAFEPMPGVAARLRENIQINGLTNVTVHEACVGSEKGTVHFCAPTEANCGIGHIAPEGDLVRPCVTLDVFLGGSISKATVIKMDIEGAEWLALRGARSILTNRKAGLAFLIETHPAEIVNYGGSIHCLLELLTRAGLRVQAIERGGPVAFNIQDSPRFWWASSQ